MIYPTVLTLALFFSQPVRALPQGSSADTPWSSSSSTYTPTTSPYSTNYPPSTTPYSKPYPPTTTPNSTYYPPTSSPYSSTTTPYSSTSTSYSSTTTSYSSTSTPYSSTSTSYSSTSTPYSPTTTPYSPTTTPYYPPVTTPYSPTYTHSKPSCTCYPTPTSYSSSSSSPYDDDDDDDTYHPSDCPCYSSTPYSSTQPPYTSPAYPPKQTTAYPPTTTPYSPSNPGTPTPLRATFDNTFDNADGSLNGVACSNGPNGLASRFPTFGDIPSFPFIGGAFDIVWNSPNCGACWAVTNPATGTTINITAVDTAGAGFNLAKEAFDKLAGDQSGLGAVDVVAKKVSPSVCGL